MMLEALNKHYGWDIPIPEIAVPATGAPNVTLEGISSSYDIMADAACLKANVSSFELLRNHYNHRPEYQ